MRINHNVTALNTYRQLSTNTDNQSKSIEKLSSGLRINRSGDDAAGLAISEKMRGQIRGLSQASRNAQDGISLIQTAEGALNETHDILQRMRELAVQSSSDTNTAADRQSIQKETDQLASEITRISNTTEFNKQSLLNGGVKSTGGIAADSFQIGANAGQSLSLEINAMDAKSLGVAANAPTATVTAATGVSTATLSSSTGAGVVAGNALALTVTSTTALKTSWDAATSGITGTVINSTNTSSQYNGYKLITTKNNGAGAAPTAAIDNTAKTITLNLASDVVTTFATTGTAAAMNNAFAAQGISLTAAGDSSGVVTPTAATGATASTMGLGAGEAAIQLAGAAGTEKAIVLTNATSATFSDPLKYNGVTVNFNAPVSTSTAATVTIGTNASTAATFTNGQKTADAVAAAGIDVSSSAAAASNAITVIDNAINNVSAERAKLGAYQNRLDHTINNLNTSSENLTSAESRIRDVDMAKEMMNQSKNGILAQAAQAMLAIANQQPQGVLQLLR